MDTEIPANTDRIAPLAPVTYIVTRTLTIIIEYIDLRIILFVLIMRIRPIKKESIRYAAKNGGFPNVLRIRLPYSISYLVKCALFNVSGKIQATIHVRKLTMRHNEKNDIHSLRLLKMLVIITKYIAR
jgi:hypothetical protein